MLYFYSNLTASNMPTVSIDAAPKKIIQIGEDTPTTGVAGAVAVLAEEFVGVVTPRMEKFEVS